MFEPIWYISAIVFIVSHVLWSGLDLIESPVVAQRFERRKSILKSINSLSALVGIISGIIFLGGRLLSLL